MVFVCFQSNLSGQRFVLRLFHLNRLSNIISGLIWGFFIYRVNLKINWKFLRAISLRICYSLMLIYCLFHYVSPNYWERILIASVYTSLLLWTRIFKKYLLSGKIIDNMDILWRRATNMCNRINWWSFLTQLLIIWNPILFQGLLICGSFVTAACRWLPVSLFTIRSCTCHYFIMFLLINWRLELITQNLSIFFMRLHSLWCLNNFIVLFSTPQYYKFNFIFQLLFLINCRSSSIHCADSFFTFGDPWCFNTERSGLKRNMKSITLMIYIDILCINILICVIHHRVIFLYIIDNHIHVWILFGFFVIFFNICISLLRLDCLL